jgi:hypothetical protein
MIVGGVEYLQTGEIVGWALDRQFGDDQLMIEAFLGDRLIGMATADLPRTDHRPETDGHGFRINLRQPLTTEAIPGLAVYATALSGERALLAISPPAPDQTNPESGGERSAAGSLSTGIDEIQSPVFILGAPRSGTTAVTQALLSLRRYDGVEEDHVLELVPQLIDMINAHYAALDEERAGYPTPEETSEFGTLDRRIPAAFINASVRSIFIGAIQNTFRSDHWVVKTPTAAMIRAAPLLREIWPRSRFIFMKRRGIENVVSRTKKFHKSRFRDQCTAWTDAMWAWTTVRAQLAGAAIEVDQLLMAREPRRAAAAIGAFLALSDSETAYLEQAFSRTRPEQTSETFGSIYDPEELSWSSEETTMFERACGSMMEEFGYDFGRSYYREGAEDRELVLV